jgi:hypothetical protein
VLETYSSKIKELKETRLGNSCKGFDTPRDAGDETKPSVRKNETELGNLITDGMLSKAKNSIRMRYCFQMAGASVQVSSETL